MSTRSPQYAHSHVLYTHMLKHLDYAGHELSVQKLCNIVKYISVIPPHIKY